MGEQLYEIVEGVRRAKAAWRCGHETITARLDELGEVMQAPLSSLLSPKPLIEDNGPRGGSWGVIYIPSGRKPLCLSIGMNAASSFLWRDIGGA